jgi:hypothetical protein
MVGGQAVVWHWLYRETMQTVAAALLVLFAHLMMQPLVYGSGANQGFELLICFIAGVASLVFLGHKTFQKINE